MSCLLVVSGKPLDFSPVCFRVLPLLLIYHLSYSSLLMIRFQAAFLFCDVIHSSSPLAKKSHWSPDLGFERAFLPSGIVYLSLVHHFWQLNLEGSRANAVVQNSVLVQLFIWITQKSTYLILRALSKRALFKHMKYFWTITCGEKFSC